MEYLEKENLITKETLIFGDFNFEMLTLIENTLDDNTKQYTGPTTDLPTSYSIISEEENLDNWSKSLQWGTMSVTLFQSVWEYEEIQYKRPKMNMVSADRPLIVDMIEQGTGWHQNWRLIMRKDNQFRGVNLPTLNDSRKAKLYVNKCNDIVPFHWDGKNLHIPKYLKLPFGMMRAIQTASMKPPKMDSLVFQIIKQSNHWFILE